MALLAKIVWLQILCIMPELKNEDNALKCGLNIRLNLIKFSKLFNYKCITYVSSH